jgi:hypothetical protein
VQLKKEDQQQGVTTAPLASALVFVLRRFAAFTAFTAVVSPLAIPDSGFLNHGAAVNYTVEMIRHHIVYMNLFISSRRYHHVLYDLLYVY